MKYILCYAQTRLSHGNNSKYVFADTSSEAFRRAVRMFNKLGMNTDDFHTFYVYPEDTHKLYGSSEQYYHGWCGKKEFPTHYKETE